jgi:hypothetical protein
MECLQAAYKDSLIRIVESMCSFGYSRCQIVVWTKHSAHREI